MYKALLSICFLFFGLFCTGQNFFVPAPPAVSTQDLGEALCPIDSTAHAAYLYRAGKTTFRIEGIMWVQVTEIYTRIKIYDKEGYDYAMPELVYFSGGTIAKGSFSRASTYNLVNGEVIKTPLKKESEFSQRINESITKKSIALPDVRPGSIIEYTTTTETPYFMQIDDFYFQFDIPAKSVYYDLLIPIYFNFEAYRVGFVDILNKDLKALNGDTGACISSNYRAENVNAFKDEAYVANREDYIGKIKHELNSIALPGIPLQNYATTWASLAQTIYKEESFGDELNYEGYFKSELKEVLKGIEGGEAKMNAVFRFVQQRMAWNQYPGFTCREGVKKAYKQKTGNVAEINLMLTAMLRYAGLDANPVLISTRDNGIAVYPSMFAYNYVIASVKLDNKVILLDATSKYTTPGLLPSRALNWVGRLIKKDGTAEEVNLTPQTAGREVVSILGNIGGDGVITGKVRHQHLAYNALTYRELIPVLQEDLFTEALEKTYNGLHIEDYTVNSNDGPETPLKEEYSFTTARHADVIGNKIYITPLLYFVQNENPFTEETRLCPIDFIYPAENKYSISLQLPEGYKIESMPKSADISMEGGMATFKYAIAVSGNSLQISVIHHINHSSIEKEYYVFLKDFFAKMIEKQNEKVVLVKAQ